MNDTVTQSLARRYPRELVQSALFLLKRLGMTAKEQAFDAYEQIGFHPYHHAILAALDEGSRETQGALAEALGYDKGQLVGLLDELEDARLIERQRDAADRRRQIVRMTPAGRKMLERLRRLAGELEEDFLGPLNEAERAQLHGLLLQLAEQHLPNCQFTAPASTQR